MKRSTQDTPERLDPGIELKTAGSLPDSDLLMLECGYRPYLKAGIGDWELRAPDFVRDNRKKIRAAIHSLDRCDRQSADYAKTETRLRLLQAERDVQRRRFQRRIARELCSRFSAIYVIDPRLEELYRRHGGIITDYGFPELIVEMRKEARKSGTAIYVENEPPLVRALQDLEESSVL